VGGRGDGEAIYLVDGEVDEFQCQIECSGDETAVCEVDFEGLC